MYIYFFVRLLTQTELMWKKEKEKRVHFYTTNV